MWYFEGIEYWNRHVFYAPYAPYTLPMCLLKIFRTMHGELIDPFFAHTNIRNLRTGQEKKQ